jgi:hypothetical protein
MSYGKIAVEENSSRPAQSFPCKEKTIPRDIIVAELFADILLCVGGLLVPGNSVRHKYDSKAGRLSARREFRVLAVNKKFFVEIANPLKDFPLDKHAASGCEVYRNGDLRFETPVVRRFLPEVLMEEIAEEIPKSSVEPDLVTGVRIENARRRNTDSRRACHRGDKLRNCFGGNVRIVVNEKEKPELPFHCPSNPFVARYGETDIAMLSQNGRLRKPRGDRLKRSVDRPVVDHQ